MHSESACQTTDTRTSYCTRPRARVCVFFFSFASRGRSARSIEAAAGRDGRAGLVDAGARVERGAREDRSIDAIERESARATMTLVESASEGGGSASAAVTAACRVVGVLIHGETERPDEDDGAEEKAREDGEAEKFAEALCAKSRGEVFEQLVAHAETLFSDGGDKEASGVVAVMANLAGEDAKAVKRVMECVTASVSERVGLRVRCAIAVYNDARGADVGTKLELFEKVAAYCVSAGQKGVLPTLIAHAGDAKAWGSDVKIQRRVLKLSVDLLRELGDREEELFSTMIKYLATFENDAGAVGEAAEIAKETARAFIASPTMFHGDFLALKGVQGLQSSDAAVFKLLSTLLTGSVNDYLALVKSSGSVISDLGLDADECMAKMRTMALSALGKKGDCAYSEIKEALQCEEAEVEECVVRAVGAGVVDAKMDQINKRVVFTRCTDRVFSGAEWQELGAKISSWRGSIDALQQRLSAN